jgi:hypothetical protein
MNATSGVERARVALAGLLVVVAVSLQALVAPAVSLAQKKSGGGQVKKSGENAADLLSGIVGPVLIVLIGAIALTALVKREVGMAVSAAVVGLIAGLFVFSPDQAQSVFEGIYDAVF